ncbi:MAG: hypothetical protein AB7T49_08205 [Oligoflexales bacterium]
MRKILFGFLFMVSVVACKNQKGSGKLTEAEVKKKKEEAKTREKETGWSEEQQDKLMNLCLSGGTKVEPNDDLLNACECYMDKLTLHMKPKDFDLKKNDFKKKEDEEKLWKQGTFKSCIKKEASHS